jgi:hypothetical protein
MHPSVEHGSALFTAARLNSHSECHPLDGVTQTYFLFDEEPRKPNLKRLAFRLLPTIRVIRGGPFLLHDAFLGL